MTMSKDLYLALLSMDAYNRGYDAKISSLGDSGHLGNATILARGDVGVDETEYADWIAASFFAVAYEFNTEDPNFVFVDDSGDTVGSTVISYRGTDQIPPNGSTWGDAWNGWRLGAGFHEASQGGLSLDFFEAVTEQDPFDAGAGDGVIVTGHSLRGGLSGAGQGLAA